MPSVENPRGERVQSRLFADLKKFTGSYEEAKKYYMMTQDDGLMSRIRGLEHDENGEPTCASFMDAIGRSRGALDVERSLGDEVKGVKSYADAERSMRRFNSSSRWRGKYVMTAADVGDGYELSIVKDEPGARQAAARIMEDASIRNGIMSLLSKYGVSVEFMKLEHGEKGRYSTINAKRNAAGMYELIKLSYGEDVTDTLAEEAGHFAIGALGDSPLVKRLLELLTPELRETMLGDKADDYLGSHPERETAGRLVGEALLGRLSKDSPAHTLVGRIINRIKNVFRRFKKGDVELVRQKAERLAGEIAGRFVSMRGSVDNAVAFSELLHNRKMSANAVVYRKTVAEVTRMADEMKAFDYGKDYTYRKMAAMTEEGIDASREPSDDADAVYLAGTIRAVRQMLSMYYDMCKLMDSIDLSDALDVKDVLPEIARKMRIIGTYLRNGRSLYEILLRHQSGIPGAANQVTGLSAALKTLADSTEMLGRIVNGSVGGNESLLASFMLKRRQIMLRQMKDVYGTDYIQTSARKVFDWKHGGLVSVDAEKIPFEDYLDYLNGDSSWTESLFGTAGGNSDIVLQMYDVMTKNANKKADDDTLADWEKLRSLKAEFVAEGFKTEDMRSLFERDDDGNLNGFIIAPLKYGKWNLEYRQFHDGMVEEYKRLHPEWDGSKVSADAKAMGFAVWFEPYRKEWHAAHSVYDVDEMRYKPKKTIYRNLEYEKLMRSKPGLMRFLDSFTELKTEMDSRLPDGYVMSNYLAPQFRGSTIGQYANRRANEGRWAAAGDTLRRETLNTFVVTSEDTDYGALVSDDMNTDPLSSDTANMHKLPVFGLKRLDDMNELSTDLFNSLLTYSSMVNTRKAMGDVSDFLELGMDEMGNRKVRGKDDPHSSHAWANLRSFLDAKVYGMTVGKLDTSFEKTCRKIADLFGRLAGIIYLGGNVHGAITNLGTGVIETLKEAVAGEFFDMSDYKKAVKSYFESLPSNLWDTGSFIKNDKVSLLIDKFNMLGENKRRFREWHTDEGRLYNWFSGSLMMPYKAGDHFMQTVSYLSMLNGRKVYTLSGEETSLFDAYEPMPIDASNPKAGSILRFRDGAVLKIRGAGDEYRMLSSIRPKLEAAVEAAKKGRSAPVRLTPEEAGFVSLYNYDVADPKHGLASVKRRLDEIAFNSDDESKLMNTAREINVLMHGVYNMQDKVRVQRNIFGNMLLSMRGYALGMIRRRFGKDRYNSLLGHEVEGSLNTVAKILFDNLMHFHQPQAWWRTFEAVFLPCIIPARVRAHMADANYSEEQYRNMRRNFGDMMFIALLALVRLLTARHHDDDEGSETDDNLLVGITYYFASRLYYEQTAFNMPSGWMREKTSLMDMTPVGVSVVGTLAEFTYLGLGAPFASEDNSKFYYQNKKVGIYEAGENKAVAKAKRLLPYYRSFHYVFEHPYNAWDSYDYGQRVKVK